MLVLVLEDDKSYAEVITHTLKRAAHEVIALGAVQEAKAFSRRKMPDLAVLDVSLPDGTGFEACASLRELSPDIPILMLSALDRSTDIVAGLDAGADDYLTKPFHPSELVARVNALIRRSGTRPAARDTSNVVMHGKLSVDSEGQLAMFDGRDLGCTKIEVDILSELVRHPSQALSHAFLTERIWGYKNMRDATLLKGHISSLRKKIRDAGGDPSVIRTVHGVGYSMSEPTFAGPIDNI